MESVEVIHQFAYSNNGNEQFDRLYFVTGGKQDKDRYKIYCFNLDYNS
jgi:hypothetical protein